MRAAPEQPSRLPCPHREDQHPHREDQRPYARRPSQDRPDNCEERELYELCQQLTRENRHLKREVADLKKLVAGREEGAFGFCSEGEDNYRELNYDCYKKKAIHLLTSLKFLQQLYVEKCGIDKREKVLDRFMGRLGQGRSNHIDELMAVYGECLNGREEEGWTLEELEQESSQFQNNLLRRHIKKLNAILLESVSALKKSLTSLKVDILDNNDKITQEMQYYCQKYFQAEPHHDPEPSIVKNAKKPKKKKAVNDENATHKASWEQIADQRSKLKEKRLEPNVKERIHESLVIMEQSGLSRPLGNSNSLRPSVPKPPSKPRRQEITIIDELQHSQHLHSVTPSHSSKATYHFANSRKHSKHQDAPSNKKSQHASPKQTNSYYR